MTSENLPAAGPIRRTSEPDETPPESRWRNNRDPGWGNDIGYAFQDTLNGHRYTPGAPGVCSCGRWQGYWVDFHPHVADQLRDVVIRSVMQ